MATSPGSTSDHGIRETLRLRLRRGEFLWRRVLAGSEFVVCRGSVRLDEVCRQVADQPVHRSTRLAGGAPHAIETAGWVGLTALAEAELRLSIPPPRTAAAVERAWRIIAGLRRVLRAAPP